MHKCGASAPCFLLPPTTADPQPLPWQSHPHIHTHDISTTQVHVCTHTHTHTQAQGFGGVLQRVLHRCIHKNRSFRPVMGCTHCLAPGPALPSPKPTHLPGPSTPGGHPLLPQVTLHPRHYCCPTTALGLGLGLGHVTVSRPLRGIPAKVEKDSPHITVPFCTQASSAPSPC